jgi:3-hydroxy-D-aspartate aldolase
MNTQYLSELDSPSILILKDKLEQNIARMIAIAGDPQRLMPHIKTSKMGHVVALMMKMGIAKFKCATIAEAELAALEGAHKVLVAHQLVGPKIHRFIALIRKYPRTQFATLVDCPAVAAELSSKFLAEEMTANVYFDINNGMDRSGHEIDKNLLEDIMYTINRPNINFIGIHVYDGHLRQTDFEERKREIEKGMSLLSQTLEQLGEIIDDFEIIAGGTPAFTSHATENQRVLSPGTCVLWDWGYGDAFQEQPFEYAALVMSRVISKPKFGIITLDMGHKAVASENSIDRRIRFLGHPDLKLVSQSEEHGVVSTTEWANYSVGDIVLGVPYHVCPTLNLYDEAYVIENEKCRAIWPILGRKRKITI